MRISRTTSISALTLIAIWASNVDAQQKKPSWRERAEEIKRRIEKGADGNSKPAESSGSGEVASATSGPRNRNPQITGVWEGVMLVPQGNPNRYKIRLSVTQRDGSLSGESKIEVPGQPLLYKIHSIDGNVEDGLIKVKEVQALRQGSDMQTCGSWGHRMMLIVRNDGRMTGDVSNTGGCDARVELTQTSTVSPELADASPAPGGTAAPPLPGAGTPQAAPAAAMVPAPIVTGSWSGTITQPTGNPNRYAWRLTLNQKDGAITGTARIEAPDDPLQYATMSVDGSVDEGIITLTDKQVLKYGSRSNWCMKRSVLLLKTDGTLSGDWNNCGGGGKVYLTKPK